MLAAGGGALLLWACTITQSLDYLQEGGEDGGPGGEAGALPVLVAAQTKPELLAQDTASLYWTSAGSLLSVAKSGGEPRQLGTLPGLARYLAVDPDLGGAVFVAVGKSILRFPKDGSDAGVIFTGGNAAPATSVVAVDEAALFVLQYADTAEDSFILRMAKDGGAGVGLTDAGPTFMTLSPSTVVWFDLIGENGALRELPKTAAPGTASKAFPLGPNDDAPAASSHLAADDSSFYWSTEGIVSLPSVVSQSRGGGPVVTLHRGTENDVFGNVAVDATHVFALENKSGVLYRIAKAGGAAERFAERLSAPTSFVVDATNVYVAVEGVGPKGGAILKTKK